MCLKGDNFLLKTVAFIEGKKKSSNPKFFIHFSIENLIANISFYALSWPKLNFGCYLTFEIIFKALFQWKKNKKILDRWIFFTAINSFDGPNSTEVNKYCHNLTLPSRSSICFLQSVMLIVELSIETRFLSLCWACRASYLLGSSPAHRLDFLGGIRE